MEDRWLSVDEICQHLGVSNDTLYKLIENDSLPAYRIGRQWKFKKPLVDEWVMQHGARNGPESNRKDTA